MSPAQTSSQAMPLTSSPTRTTPAPLGMSWIPNHVAPSQARCRARVRIGSGPDCDGQILVTHDLIGLYPWFTPRHVRPRLDAASQVVASVRGWKADLVLPPVARRPEREVRPT